MVSGGDMARAEEAISKQELRGDAYKQSSIANIQKRQREAMKWHIIGRSLALVFVLSIIGFLYFSGSK